MLVYWVDWKDIKTQLPSSDLIMIAIVLFIMVVQFPLSTYKWRKCMEMHELYYPFLHLQKILCIGFFFNTFLPTSIGGDGYRVIKTIPKDVSKSRAISAVLIERIIGLVVLLFLGFLSSAIIVFQTESYIINLYLITGIALFAFCTFSVILYVKGYLKGILEKFTSIKKLDVIVINLKYIINNKKKLFDVTIISILFQLMAISSIFILFKAFQAETFFLNCAIIAALTGVFSLLPISINGIGVVEGGFVYVAMQLGVPLEQAVIVAFMLRVLTLPLSIICGIIYLVDSGKVHNQ